MNKMNFALSAALLVLAAGACQAEDAVKAPVAPVAATAASANIDTWIEGAIITLDADGQKFSVRGVKLPHPTVEAEMMADIAAKTKDLDVTARAAKDQEVRASWAEKLNKAHGEQLASSTSDFNFSLPDKSTLAVMKGSDPKASPNALVASSGINETHSVASDAQLKGANATTDVKVNTDSSAKELAAVKTLKDLKVGDKVKVGYDAGLTYNTAYVVVVE